jgi:hypothetical protein
MLEIITDALFELIPQNLWLSRRTVPDDSDKEIAEL